MSYPSPSSSDTTDTLPTPSLPSAFSSRRPTIASPTMAPGSESQTTSPSDLDERRHSFHGGETSKETPLKARRESTGLGMGMVPSISVDMDETPTRPRRTASTRTPIASGGLNIRGLTLPTAGKIVSAERASDRDGAEEKEDEADSLAELAPSPRVAAFKAALAGPSPKIPLSPAWQSFDASPSMSRGPGSPPNNASVPSPLGPRVNERRFDPTPTHGLHARNLSLYFPSPGQQAISRGVNGSADVFQGGQHGQQEEGGILPAGEEKKAFGGKGGWSFGERQDHSQALSPEHARGKRRGHHHKHSLSHNFFSFLDPTVTNPSLAAPKSPSPHPDLPSSKSSQFPASVPIPLQSSSTSLLGSASSRSNAPNRRLDPHTQLYLSVAVIEFLIGAGLWVEGQLSGWRCLAGVGYLSVFDAAGVAIRILRDGEGSRSTRSPYGTARFMTLLYFAQSLFLVFASVYIAKESIETVLLGEGAHSHGGGGGHGHGHEAEHAHGHEGESEERSLPTLLLLVATISSLFSGIVLRNHSKLVESVGPLFLPSILSNSKLVKRLEILRNPFTLTVAAGSAAILLGSMIVPPPSLHMLDSALSLLLTLATSALAYPTTRSFALVLLQTAPVPTSGQMTSLRQSLKSISDDRRILGIGSTRVWMIASTGCDTTSSSSSRPRSSRSNSMISDSAPSSPDAPSFSRKAGTGVRRDSGLDGTGDGGGDGSTKLSVSVVVHVNDDVADRDVLDVTKYVWNRVSAAVGEGEFSIAVKRGWEGMEVS